MCSCLKVMAKAFKFPHLSSKKLLDIGFKYKYNLGDMYDGAIASCKQVGLTLGLRTFYSA